MSPTPDILPAGADQYLLLAAFVDELARCGLREACTSPGSRSTPLVLSLVRDRRLRCHSHIDERASGFFALGVAKASGRPAAVACTSGTATAELLPAVIEAREARVPMIVLTADRPPELREVGAGQTIDQLKLYGDAAKWFFEVGTHAADERGLRWMRTLACRAWATSLEQRPGVVHLNFALREPLVFEGALPADHSGRPGGAPYVTRCALGPSDTRSLPLATEALARWPGGRGVLVAGRHERETPLGAAALAFCRAAGWPLLADPLSGARRGPQAVAHYDALLRDPSFAATHRPDFVVRVGDLPPSKALRDWLATAPQQLSLDPEGAWQDPDSVLSHSWAVEPAAGLDALTAALTASVPPTETASPWLARWRRADMRAAKAIAAELGRDRLSEPLVAAELGRLLPPEATLFVASSMPVRDVETFWAAREEPPRVLCNRAANGIDGTVASALGVAAAAPGPTVALIGDVALVYDIGAVLGALRLARGLTIVLLNNDGGGIFDFLAVGDMTDSVDVAIYREHVATPPRIDFAAAAALAGASHECVGDVGGLAAALARALAGEGLRMIEVRSDRAENVALHRRVWDAVAMAVARDAPTSG